MRKYLVLTLLFFIFFFIPNSLAQTQITNCTVIDTTGEYYLTQDIIDSSALTCIDIQANNVVFDCQGHTIDGIGTDNSNGIQIIRSFPIETNVTIKNCILTDWYRGLYLWNSSYNILSFLEVYYNKYGIVLYSNSSYNTLSDSIINLNTHVGIQFSYSDHNNLTNITVNSTQYIGVALWYSNYNTLSNMVLISNGAYALDIDNSNYAIIKNSIIQNNSYGIYLTSSTANMIYNNLFNNSNNFLFGVIYPNYWNTTETFATNIVGGNWIGGNYWGKPDGTGYSDTCTPKRYNFCDPYTLATDNIDYLPLSLKYVSPPIEITNCTVIDTPGEYVLVNDIPYPAYYPDQFWCIQIAVDNVTLDCSYHSMTGNTSGSAIWFMNRNNVTVKNCLANNYDEIIWVKGNNSRFENIEVWSGHRGIALVESINMTVINFTAHDLNGEGIATQNTNSSEFTGIKSYSNNVGISLDNFNNTLTDSEFWNITDKAISINGTGGHIVRNVVVRDSSKIGIWIDWSSNNNLIDSATIYNLPNDFAIYITSDNNAIKNSVIHHTYKGIGVHSEGDFNFIKNITIYNTSTGLETFGTNHIFEDIEVYYTTPENPGIRMGSRNTTLRNIYTHDEYRSVIESWATSTLEYSRCSNVIYGCWHILANNTIVRHNNFPDSISLFGTFYTEVYNNTFGRPDKVFVLEIRDWQGVAPSFNKIYNNTFNNSGIWNRWLDYQPNSNEIYNNSFYLGIVVDEGFNTSIHDNTFKGCTISIAFFNGATNSNAFLNYINDGSNGCENVTISNIFGNETMYLGELCSPYAFYFNGAKGITINNNTIETDTLAYFRSDPAVRLKGVISDVLSCNNTIVAFNKSFAIDKDYPPILLNVMRIESSQCTPFLDVTFYPSVDFGAVNPYSVVKVFPNLTVSSNMINLTYQIRGDTDWIGETQNFSISTLSFTVDKNLPYPTKIITLELNVFKAIYHFLVNQFNNILENMWRFEVPLVRAGNYNANTTLVVST
jgi:parallel beta-helix repeat protein